MRKNMTHALLAALALAFAPMAYADGPGDAGPDVAAPPVRAAPQQPAATPAPEGRAGQVAFDEFALNVPQGWRFYSAEEARAYLDRARAPHPSGEIYGMLARAGADIRQPSTWTTIVSYDDIGYVQPETAAGLSDTNFEGDVRNARTAQDRAFEGFAENPNFAADAPTLVWAERAAAPGSQGPDLRYEKKLPARYGVAGLTGIGSADQMTEIAAAANEITNMISFPAGRRHADFDAATDRVSNYTVPGLVTGVPRTEPQAVAQTSAAGGGSAQTGFGGMSGWFPWIAFGVILLAIIGFLMMRNRGKDEAEV